jgi:hypothetical protein
LTRRGACRTAPTTEEKAGPAPEAPAGAAAEAPPPSGSRTDRRATQRELHGTEGREELPHNNTQPLDISAVHLFSRWWLCRMCAREKVHRNVLTRIRAARISF